MSEVIRQIVECEARAAGERTLTFTASTEQVARDAEIVLVKGWQTEQFEKNPVFLWSHNAWEPPIGRVTRIKKVRGKKARLEVDVEFAGLEQLHDLAEQIHLLYRDGFLKAVSVGFRVIERREPTEEETQSGARGVVTKAELMEISAVTVPADTDALVQAEAAEGEVREAALAVRSYAPEQPPITETITVADMELIRAVIREEFETIGADISAGFSAIQARLDTASRERTPPQPPATSGAESGEGDDDLWGLADAFHRDHQEEDDLQ
jgi:HK97 family phage prohead protease